MSYVVPREGGPYSLFCTNCKMWVPNTANAEMRKEGFYAHSHSCGRVDLSEISDESWQRKKRIRENWGKLKVGDKVYIPGEKRPYRVQARDDRYVICTKPFNPKHTVMYFIADLRREVRGPDDMVFCLGYETKAQCEERLLMLKDGTTRVSSRRCVKLEEDVNGETTP